MSLQMNRNIIMLFKQIHYDRICILNFSEEIRKKNTKHLVQNYKSSGLWARDGVR